MKTIQNLIPAVLILLGAGCSWTDKRGTRHTVILGAGVVSTKQQAGVTVQDCNAVGLVCNRGVTAGWTQQHLVLIDPKTAGDVVTSIKATPLTLTVTNFDTTCQQTNLNTTNQPPQNTK